MTGRRGGAVLAVTLGIVLSACSGVPTKSTPQIIGPVRGGTTAVAPTVAPAAGADPRSIVKGFLSASASSDQHHSAARSFLTADARNRWSDTTVTIVDSELIGNFDSVESTVTMSGRQMGTSNAAGVYTPVLKGSGAGGDAVPFSFGLRRIGGEWRINSLKNGIVIGYDEFQRLYEQRPLYFLNLTDDRLVPDPRFTPLVDPSDLATWLVGQLAAGPRPELQEAVNTSLPAQIDPRSVTVTIGAVSAVEVPGASQLDASTRNQLAAQLALTLQPVMGQAPLSITDGGKTVRIPAFGSTQFTASQFSALVAPPTLAPALYYLRGGGVADASGRALPGAIGSGGYNLTSVAVSAGGAADVPIAATNGPISDSRLVIGTQRTGLRTTTVHGVLSRPAWVPFLDEVWVGDGAMIYRTTIGGRSSVVQLSASVGTIAGRVEALRLSPEGSRVAMVLAARDGTAQLWLGAVVRNAGQVRVDSLEPISPLGVVVTDVAWNDQLKLFLIGRSPATGESSIYEVQVDGSLWTPRSIANLPPGPDSITVAENAPAWVSAGGTVWTQRGGSWASPGSDTTFGTAPVYAD